MRYINIYNNQIIEISRKTKKIGARKIMSPISYSKEQLKKFGLEPFEDPVLNEFQREGAIIKKGDKWTREIIDFDKETIKNLKLQKERDEKISNKNWVYPDLLYRVEIPIEKLFANKPLHALIILILITKQIIISEIKEYSIIGYFNQTNNIQQLLIDNDIIIEEL